MSSRLLRQPICYLIDIFLLLLLISSFIPSALSASRRPIADNEIRNRKNACYVDIERTSVTEKENCALRCLSSACYHLIYESDPLEEGERDENRSHEYKYCLHSHCFESRTLLINKFYGLLDSSNIQMWDKTNRNPIGFSVLTINIIALTCGIIRRELGWCEGGI